MQLSQAGAGASQIGFLTLLAFVVAAADARADNAWTGGYVGVSGAYSRSLISGTTVKADGTVGANATSEAANALRDEAAGLALILGVRKRLDSGLILGLEADVAYLGHQTRNANLINSGAYTGQPSATLEYETPWLSTARAVAGWSFGDLLVFASGGAAFATEKVTRTQYRAVGGTSVTEAAFSETDRETRVGYALGAGLEWRWGKPWALRADYLHVRFPDQTFHFPDARGGAQASFTNVQGRIATNDAHSNTVRIGLTYTFGIGN
jgi:opacity protein-like surface antigen